MAPPPAPPVQRATPVWVWALVAVGAACFLCGGGALAVMALGAMAGDGAGSGAGPSGRTARPQVPAAAPYRVAASVARSPTLEEPLVGRWLSMTGGDLERVLSEGTFSRVVEVTSTGHLHELVFSEDGTYSWVWLYVSNYLIKTRAWAKERGSWRLEGTTLTLTPESWEAEYTAGTTQHRENEQLTPRQDEVTSITLETFEVGGQPAIRFPGISIRGAPPAWDIESDGQLTLDLQRQ